MGPAFQHAAQRQCPEDVAKSVQTVTAEYGSFRYRIASGNRSAMGLMRPKLSPDPRSTRNGFGTLLPNTGNFIGGSAQKRSDALS